jgi:hypothetical protein
MDVPPGGTATGPGAGQPPWLPRPAAPVRQELIAAFTRARDSGDTAAMADAALRLPSVLEFGAPPGQVPALIHEAYAAATDPAARGRLAAALARAWVYGGDPARAVAFAAEAVDLAEQAGDPGVLADALDAALATRWGPDDFASRLALAARLAAVAAHLTAPAARLSAHLWRLTTAWECLDIVAVQRQLRALDLLAAESGSARDAFFATSRRAMHALVTADLDTADQLIGQTGQLGETAAEPDLTAVTHSLAADRAMRAGDTATLLTEAASFEEYGASHGIASVSAEAAVFWLAGGRQDRAAGLARTVAGAGLDSVPRDVDFLLTVSSVTAVAAAAGLTALAADGARLLEPYAGRAVLNAGAVTFHGVVDDYLFRAHQALGQPGAARWRDAAAACYTRLGAGWWASQLSQPGPFGSPGAGMRATVTAAAAPAVLHFHPGPGPGWTVGPAGATVTVARARGLDYLRYLLQCPGTDVPAADLAAAATAAPAPAGPAGTAVQARAHGLVTAGSSPGDLADAQALAAYRARLTELDAELAEAESWADEGRVTRLRLERGALLDEVAAATGLAGRSRRFSSAEERARVSVRKAIAAALRRIEAADPALARLLDATVRTGAVCRYDPDPGRPVRWLLTPPRGAGNGRDGRDARSGGGPLT